MELVGFYICPPGVGIKFFFSSKTGDIKKILLHTQGLPGRPGEKGSPGEPVSRTKDAVKLL